MPDHPPRQTMVAPEVQEGGAGDRKPPSAKTTSDPEPNGPLPRDLYAPAVEGPIILPKSKPRIVRGDDE